MSVIVDKLEGISGADKICYLEPFRVLKILDGGKDTESINTPINSCKCEDDFFLARWFKKLFKKCD